MVWVLNARILSVFVVIFLHASATTLTNSEFDTAPWWWSHLYDSASRWCVPVMIMVSGYLLLPRVDQSSNFYKKRVLRILLPLIFWSLFFLFWDFLKTYRNGETTDMTVVIQNVAAGKPYYHLWFLFMISGLYAFTPVFKLLISAVSFNTFIGLTGFLFVLSAMAEMLDLQVNGALLLFLPFIPFYFTGYILTKISINPILAIFMATIGFGTVMIGHFILGGNNFYFYEYLSVPVIIFSLGIIGLLSKINTPIFEGKTKAISDLSFGIYLIHPAVLEIVYTLGLLKLNPAISIPLIASIVFTLSGFSVWILTKTPARRII